jgi:hypothetical protein
MRLKIPRVSAAANVNPAGFTISELWEDLAVHGRAPRKEHLAVMLRHLGYIEEGATWILPKDPSSLSM